MITLTYYKNEQAMQFIGFNIAKATWEAKRIMNEKDKKYGYFKPRMGTDKHIYDWTYVKEITDEDLRRVLGR